MKLGRMLNEFRRLLGPVSPEASRVPVQRQPEQWVARNRCW
jgi:hypothetical protein